MLIVTALPLSFEDDRQDHGEERVVTCGVMKGKVVACVRTYRGDNRRIISLRKAEKDEREIYNLHKP